MKSLDLISLTTIFVVFSLYLIIKHFLVRSLQSKYGMHNNDSKRIRLTINVIDFVMMLGLIVFLFIGWFNRFQDGNHNYFNLILLIVLTIACVIRFFNKFKRNKIQ